MELRLQKFVNSMVTLSDIRNIDPSNPIIFKLEHPVTATVFTTMAAISEPSYMAVPVYTTWAVLDPVSPNYKKCLKLVAITGPTSTPPIPGITFIPGLNQSWKLIDNYDEIFDTPQHYENGGGLSGVGDKGDTGPAGPQGLVGSTGLQGPTPAIDYPYIISQVMALLAPALTLTGLAINGLASLNENGSTTYTATATFSDGSTGTVTPLWSLSVGAPGTISVGGLFSASAVGSNTGFTVLADYTLNGVTVHATKAVTVVNVVPTALNIFGANTVNEGANSTYTATVSYSDGSSAAAVPAWTVGNAMAGSITSGGVFTAALVGADYGSTINASITVAGVPLVASKPITVSNIATIVYPYYGPALATAPITAALVLGLASRGTQASRLMSSMTIIDSLTNGMYYAYPTSYGLATFTDLGNMFQGGWDGAHKDGGSTFGPVTIDVSVDGAPVPFYVYQSDYPNISPLSSPTNWSVT